mgnify:CR=1 FL=1
MRKDENITRAKIKAFLACTMYTDYGYIGADGIEYATEQEALEAESTE